MPGEDRKIRTGGATSWPRLKIRPRALPLQDIAFELLYTYTRPIVQLIIALNILFPYWKQLAEFCLDQLGWSEPMFYAMATIGFHHVTYAIVNGFYVTIDHFGWLQQYKLYTPEISQPSSSLKWEAFRGSVLATLPMFGGSYFLAFPLFKYFGMPHPTEPLPSPFKLWIYFCVVKTYATFTFDLVHRIIHSRKLYSKIHAQHHRFIATVSIAAEFAHPIEGLSSILAPMVYGTHPFVWCMWLVWSQVDAGMTHRCVVTIKLRTVPKMERSCLENLYLAL